MAVVPSSSWATAASSMVEEPYLAITSSLSPSSLQFVASSSVAAVADQVVASSIAAVEQASASLAEWDFQTNQVEWDFHTNRIKAATSFLFFF